MPLPAGVLAWSLLGSLVGAATVRRALFGLVLVAMDAPRWELGFNCAPTTHSAGRVATGARSTLENRIANHVVEHMARRAR